MEFYNTIMGKRFFEDTCPRMVHELEKLNECLSREYEEEIIPMTAYYEYNKKGWRYKDSFESDQTYIVVVKYA